MMQRKEFLKKMAVAVILPSVLLAACSDKTPGDGAAKGEEQTYTCPMHPQIVQKKPGTCPICGMDLVAFDKNNKDESLQLMENQVALANISTITVGAGNLSAYTQLNGRLAINPEQTEFISSRVPGRLEALYVKETGVPVRKGQPLYKIYSEQLASLQQEYLIALAQVTEFPSDVNFRQIFQAARQKLVLYGMHDTEIHSIKTKKRSHPFVTYYSPASGLVAELLVTEGQYVGEGSSIMRLEGYGSLWVEADVYPAEIKNVRTGQQVKVIVPGWEDEAQNMTVSFLTPSLEIGRQVTQIRGTIPNPNNQWQPGLQAFVLLPSKTAGKALTLPVDAVIREQRGTHVWIEKEKGKYVPQMVTTGMETFDRVEITSGLKEGDKVVATGAYLLYSEYVLKKGKNPMDGVKM